MPYEDDIRAALRLLAGQAPDADAVATAVLDRLSPAHPGLPSHRTRPGSGRRLLIPLAAAAAVIGVIAASVVIAQGGQGGNGPEAATFGPLPPSHKVPPPYFMWIPAGRPYGSSGAVADTATGAILAVIRPPKPYSFAEIATAADDRTFALAAWSRKPCRTPGSVSCVGPNKLFIARYDPAAQAITLRSLPFRGVPSPTGIALSPDGTELALAENSGLQNQRAEIRVYSLTRNTVKVWRGAGQVDVNGAVGLSEMSWGPRGELAFTWTGDKAAAGGIWILNTNAPNGTLTSAGRLAVLGSDRGHYALHASFALSGDGKIITAAVETRPSHSHHDVFQFEQFSAATGREIRALWPTRSSNGWVSWSNSSGSVLIGSAPLIRDTTSAVGQLVVLRGQKFTAIPWDPNAILAWPSF